MTGSRGLGGCACLLVSLLAGCAATPPVYSPTSLDTAEQLERRLTPEVVRDSPDAALADLGRAHRLYSLLDHQEGQLRVGLRRARLLLGLGRRDEARADLAQVRLLVERLRLPPYRYELHLIEGRLDDSDEAFIRALAVAETPLQRAVALSYLGRSQEAYQQARGVEPTSDDAADDLGFVLYRYAAAVRGVDPAEGALELFKRAESSEGILACLRLLGAIYAEQGQPEMARGYLERALAVARALGDENAMHALESDLGVP